MTYKLPFELKQKPLRHYFVGGSISFSCIEGELIYSVKVTTKHGKYDLFSKKVHTKDQLNKLLSIKSINEIIEKLNTAGEKCSS